MRVITEQEIKMFEKAEEIQFLRKDYVFDGEDGDLYAVEGRLYYRHQIPEEVYESDDKVIWLPTQVQLQEIVNRKLQTNYSGLLQDFTHFAYEVRYRESNPAIGYFNSMEQLWLAFMMCECYQKIWNGTDWIEKKTVSLDKVIILKKKGTGYARNRHQRTPEEDS